MWRKCYSLIQNEKFCKCRLDEIVGISGAGMECHFLYKLDDAKFTSGYVLGTYMLYKYIIRAFKACSQH